MGEAQQPSCQHETAPDTLQRSQPRRMPDLSRPIGDPVACLTGNRIRPTGGCSRFRLSKGQSMGQWLAMGRLARNPHRPARHPCPAWVRVCRAAGMGQPIWGCNRPHDRLCGSGIYTRNGVSAMLTYGDFTKTQNATYESSHMNSCPYGTINKSCGSFGLGRVGRETPAIDRFTHARKKSAACK